MGRSPRFWCRVRGCPSGLSGLLGPCVWPFGPKPVVHQSKITTCHNEIIVKAFGKDFTLTPDTYEENEYVQQSIGEQIGLKVNKDE